MKNFKLYPFLFFIFHHSIIFSQVYFAGTVKDSEGKPKNGVNIYCQKSNSGTSSDVNGNYFLNIKNVTSPTIKFSHIGYKPHSVKPSVGESMDTIIINIVLEIATSDLPIYDLSSKKLPDTVFSSVFYNVADFDFYKDKILLLVYPNKIAKDAEIILADGNSKILFSLKIESEPRELFRDYEGFINLVCTDTVFRIIVNRNEIFLTPINYSDFNQLVRPCIDTIDENILFSDYYSGYPEFNYYAYSPGNRKISKVKNIIDKPLMREFRYEYYFLPSREKLMARRFAIENATDKHLVAAAMTGFQKSFYYTPLYAPLFVISDSVLIFDHYENKLYYFNDYLEPLDSVVINYHYAKNEKWDRRIIKDEQNDKIYTLFLKDGYCFLKRIDIKTGNIVSEFKLYHKYVEKIKIKGDCVYYIYRPFESLRKKFLYKEFILSE